jgi:hypothetical protein
MLVDWDKDLPDVGAAVDVLGMQMKSHGRRKDDTCD